MYLGVEKHNVIVINIVNLNTIIIDAVKLTPYLTAM